MGTRDPRMQLMADLRAQLSEATALRLGEMMRLRRVADADREPNLGQGRGQAHPITRRRFPHDQDGSGFQSECEQPRLANPQNRWVSAHMALVHTWAVFRART
jgi:hypothetical protein